MFDRIGTVPNFFYDFIVYFTPTIGLVIGVSVGVSGSFLVIEREISELGALGTIVTFMLLIFGSYEYGRLAETFSDLFVGKVIERLRGPYLFSSKDYRRKLRKQVELLPINTDDLEGRADSKWTLFFFAQFVSPAIGSDLLKRYAWEKLARSSGFTAAVLTLVSLFVHGFELLAGTQLNAHQFQFGSIYFTLTTFFIYVLLLIDYYKRNAWNNDLLITTVPVLVEIYAQIEKSSNKQISAVENNND